MQWACAVLSSGSCLALQYFTTLCQTVRFSKKKKVAEHKMCVLIRSTIFVWNISYSKKKWASYFICVGLHVKHPLFLSDFNETLIFSTDFLKILKFQISWKFVRWEPSCSLRTDRRDEANSHFSEFCECVKKWNGWTHFPTFLKYTVYTVRTTTHKYGI
jgi:hypothetical protein